MVRTSGARMSVRLRCIGMATSGMQRYAAFLWSGDVFSTWETLKTHVPVAINTGLSGIPYLGDGIGGFVPTKEFTGELYVRWFQFGASVRCSALTAAPGSCGCRGAGTPAASGRAKSSAPRRRGNPDPSELHNAAVEPICRKFLELDRA